MARSSASWHSAGSFPRRALPLSVGACLSKTGGGRNRWQRPGLVPLRSRRGGVGGGGCPKPTVSAAHKVVQEISSRVICGARAGQSKRSAFQTEGVRVPPVNDDLFFFLKSAAGDSPGRRHHLRVGRGPGRCALGIVPPPYPSPVPKNSPLSACSDRLGVLPLASPSSATDSSPDCRLLKGWASSCRAARPPPLLPPTHTHTLSPAAPQLPGRSGLAAHSAPRGPCPPTCARPLARSLAARSRAPGGAAPRARARPPALPAAAPPAPCALPAPSLPRRHERM